LARLDDRSRAHCPRTRRCPGRRPDEFGMRVSSRRDAERDARCLPPDHRGDRAEANPVGIRPRGRRLNERIRNPLRRCVEGHCRSHVQGFAHCVSRVSKEVVGRASAWGKDRSAAVRGGAAIHSRAEGRDSTSLAGEERRNSASGNIAIWGPKAFACVRNRTIGDEKAGCPVADPDSGRRCISCIDYKLGQIARPSPREFGGEDRSENGTAGGWWGVASSPIDRAVLPATLPLRSSHREASRPLRIASCRGTTTVRAPCRRWL
jgi:hypothetical protein